MFTRTQQYKFSIPKEHLKFRLVLLSTIAILKYLKKMSHCVYNQE